MLRMACFKWLPFVVRVALVILLWLVVAPWCTSWLYRMWLLRASAMMNVNFSERFDGAHIVADIFSGAILIVCIVFSFLALMSFADFLRFHLDNIEEPEEELHHHHHHHHNHAHHHAPAHRNQPPLQPQLAQAQAPAQAGDLLFDAQQQHEEQPPRRPREMDNMDPHDVVDSDDSSDEEWQARENPFRDVFVPHQLEINGIDGQVQPREPARNELRRRQPQQMIMVGEAPEQNAFQAQQPPPAQHQLIDNRPEEPRINNPPPRAHAPANNNREWEDDFEHMEINIAMDELLGLRGDLVVLFRNVSWLLAFNGAYLGLFAFIPYTLGSTILSAGGKIMTAFPGVLAAFEELVTVDAAIADQDLSIGTVMLRMLYESVERSKKQGDCLQLVDLCTCLMGYLSICLTIMLWRIMVTTASSYIHRPLMGGLLWALRCLLAIVKVTTLLLLKMVILPIVLGLGIDFATLHLFMVSAQDRIAFCMQNMVGALMIHWILGITFMLFVTVAILQLREVMHPDILAKVIRPQENHPDLLRTLLSEKCVKHARRMILSLAIYAALLTVLIYVPVRLGSFIMPAWFPLTLHFQHYSAEIQVPLELLAVHLVVLGVLESAKNEIGHIQHVAMTIACKYLGLSEYLLPRATINERTSNGSHKPVDVVLPPPPLDFHPQAQVPPEQLRIEGHRYLPWPEEGLDDVQPTEYELLPRKTPSHLSLRLAGLGLFFWVLCVLVLIGGLFGTLFVGRQCMGPFMRVTGIVHDPIVMAAGVQIMWYFLNGMNALVVLTRAGEKIEPSLLQRGYCVRNMSSVNVVTSAIGWAVVCPFLVGYLVSACFPSANSSWSERFWMGYLLFNLFAWVICCFRTRANTRRRRRRRQHENNNDLGVEDDAMDHFDPEDEEDDDEDEEDLDFHHDEHHAAAANGDEGAAVGDRPPEPEGFVACIRTSFQQVMFNITVHDDDDIRLGTDNIRERCFDVEFFQTQVLRPVVFFLVLMIIAPTLLSTLVMLVFSSWSNSSNLEAASFAISCLSIGSAVMLLQSHSHVSQWLSNVSESIRNERYLIGRQLQDMAR